MRKTVVDRFGTHARKKLILAIWLLSVVFSVDAQQRKKVDVVRAVGAEIIIWCWRAQSGSEVKERLVTLVDMVNKLIDMTGKEKYAQNIKDTDVYIKELIPHGTLAAASCRYLKTF